MENINLTKEEIKNFCKKYNSEELENIKGLFEFAHEYNLDEAIKILEEVQTNNSIKEETADEFRLNELNNRELNFLHDVVDDANFFFRCVTDLIDYREELSSSSDLLRRIEQEQDKRDYSQNTVIMTREELNNLFNKYNLIELDSFAILVNNVDEENKDETVTAIQRVYKEKSKEADEEYFYITRHIILKPSNISNKNSLLTDKELEFILNMVNNTINAYVDSNSTKTEIFEDLGVLIISLNNEKTERKQKVKTKKD